MLTDQEISYIRKRLQEAVRPLFFYDDDADGVSSFIQMYRVVGDGKGIAVKGKPILEAKYIRKVEEYSPDVVFVLDKSMIEQEFLDAVKTDVIWLDHHPLQDNKNVEYFNPRKENPKDDRPTSYWAYQITKDLIKDSLWQAMVGIVGDWHLLLQKEFNSAYPYLLDSKIKTPEEALFNSNLGKIIKVINWNLKGSTTEVNKSVKILTRITDPYEILEQKTPRGKLLYKKFQKMNGPYEDLLSRVQVTKDKFIVFRYNDNSMAISSELSNEILYKNPNKVIIVARDVGDEMRLSLRTKKINILKILQEALKVTTGYGGGHNNACGASIKQSEFDEFIKVMREEVDNLSKK